MLRAGAAVTVALPRPDADAEALLGSFAHELRGPLNVCVMWLELLTLKAGDPQEVHKAVAVMRRNLAQQASLIRELDDIGRMLGGGIELELAPVDLTALLARAADGWRATGAEQGVELARRLPAGPMLVDADSERLLQAFGYWFENALAATTRNGGRIELTLDRVGDEAEIRFEDNGVGLTEADAAQFFTTPLEGARRQKTLGLRVVIGKHLLARHGGSVGVASAGVDAGCTWTARLPLKA